MAMKPRKKYKRKVKENVVKNEVLHIIQKYFGNKENSIKFIGNADKLNDLVKFFDCLIPFDRPDAYAMINDRVLILEHFEFDSSNKGRKGSQQVKEQVRLEREFAKANATEEGIIVHGEMCTNYTMENYKANILEAFEQHYNKINEYKNNLIKNGKATLETEFITLFFIEDVTELGNLYVDRNGCNTKTLPVILPFCDFFLEKFQHSPLLDCVLCASWMPNRNEVWYIDHSMIDDYISNKIYSDSIRIIDFQPHLMGIKIIIPEQNQ